MLEYLQKFNNLPDALKQKVSNAEAMKKIEALEKKYGAALAVLIMKVMAKEIPLSGVAQYLLKENLAEKQAENLAFELERDVFSQFSDYFSSPERVEMPDERRKQEKQAPKASGFFFHSEDEEEIRKLAEQIAVAEKISASETTDEKLKRIIDAAGINFGSSELSERFSNILRIYLRGIRNKIDTISCLIKPFANGGLSFDESSADQVMSLVDKIAAAKHGQRLAPLPKIKIPELEARDAVYDFSKMPAVKKPEAEKSVRQKIDTAHELAPLVPDVVRRKKEVGPISAPAPEPAKDVVIKRRFESENSNQSGKIKVEDVKYVPRVMGPLDEIKYMDLASFRRLDRDPSRSADKIKSKICLLEQENYGQKLESVKFWRSSPIYKLYLEIGNASIGENKPVDVIIEERKMRNQEYLTSEEFQAVMDLNRNLRF